VNAYKCEITEKSHFLFVNGCKNALSVSSEIEVMLFSFKDFNLQNPFVKEILETGVKLT